jgi:MFS family permease
VNGLSRHQWFVVGLMVALSVVSYVDRTVMSLAGPSIIKEFGISETQMGTVYSAFLLSYAVLMAPGGWLADRVGARAVLGLMGVGATLCTFLTPLAATPALAAAIGLLPMFLLVRFVLGAFTAPLYPALARVSADRIPPLHRARVQGFVIGGAPLGGAVTPIAFTWLIATYGWRASFYVAAAITAVMTALWLWFMREQSPASRAAPLPVRTAAGNLVWRRLLGNRNLVLLTAGYFTINYFEYIFFYWIYYYFGQIRNMGAQDSAVYTTVLLLSMMVGMPAGGALSDRLVPLLGARRSRLLVAGGGMALSAVCLFAGTQMTRDLPMVALLSLALALAAAAEGPYWSAAIEAGGADVGAACGFMNGVGNIGGLLAPVLTPYIASQFGWPASLYFASALILAGAATWIFVDPAPGSGKQLEPTLTAI